MDYIQMPSLVVKEIVFAAIELTNLSREQSAQIPISADSPLFGQSGYWVSMGLVALLIDIEDMLSDKGTMVSLNDERAISICNSPFRNVESLVNCIDKIVNE
jgi:hypothetical protein